MKFSACNQFLVYFDASPIDLFPLQGKIPSDFKPQPTVITELRYSEGLAGRLIRRQQVLVLAGQRSTYTSKT